MRASTIARAALFLVAAGSPAYPQDVPQDEPLAVEATALVPLETESALTIVGITGRIIVSSRDERELRVVSRGLGPDGAELPVGVWQVGSRMIVAPAPGQADESRLLRVEIPKRFALEVKASGSEVTADAIDGSIDITGDALQVVIHGCREGIEADVTGGSLGVYGSRTARVRARDTKLLFAAMEGDVDAHAVGGTVTVREGRAGVDLETEDAVVTIEALAGGLHVKATKGAVALKGFEVGATLELSGATLDMKEGKGDVTVTTDSTVMFRSMNASMHLDMYGGSLRGTNNDGILEVRIRNSEINVESIERGMRVQGEGLNAKIVDIGGELYVEASVSDVVIDKATAAEVHLDRGSLTLQRTTGAVRAIVSGGNVQILDGSGPVDLDLSGGDAEVSWASISGDKDSQLVNKSGSITARFPAGATCRVEAKTKYGRIESMLPTVRVADDASSAQGPINSGQRPIIHVVAEHDIRLLDGSSSEPEN